MNMSGNPAVIIVSVESFVMETIVVTERSPVVNQSDRS